MKKKKLSGFTLVEIMVVVGIIGLLLTMAIPNFINARRKARATVCVSNLHQIHAAKQQWALDNDAPSESEPTSDVLVDYLEGNRFPSCPAGGTYTPGIIDVVPICGIGTAGTADIDWDDHIF